MSSSQCLSAHGLPIGSPVQEWTGRAKPDRTPVVGSTVTLEPLNLKRHGDDLQEAFDLDGEGKMWTYLPKGPFNGDRPSLDAWLQQCEESADPLFFAVVSSATGKALGYVSFLRLDPANGVMEVGWVTLSPAVAGTKMSTEFQFLMMKRCFDELGYRRYEWKCDSLNAASNKAAERLGFTFEGTFRQAVVYKGRNRDTSWYSMLDSEWPVVKHMFETWLDPTNFDNDGRQLKSLQECKSAETCKARQKRQKMEAQVRDVTGGNVGWNIHAPAPVALSVLEYLSQDEIFRIAKTCQVFFQASNAPRLFKRLQLQAVGRHSYYYEQFLAQPRFAAVEELDMTATGATLQYSRVSDLIYHASRSCPNVRVLKITYSQPPVTGRGPERKLHQCCQGALRALWPSSLVEVEISGERIKL